LNEVVHGEAEVRFCGRNVGGEGVKTIPGEMRLRPNSVRSEIVRVWFLPVYEHITIANPHKRTLHGRGHLTRSTDQPEYYQANLLQHF